MKKLLLPLIAVAGLILGAVAFAQTRAGATGGTARKGTGVTVRKTTGATVRKSTGGTAVAKAPAVKPDLMHPATLNAKAPAVFRARLTTTKGPVVIEVTRAWAPLGADRFYNLVRAGFFSDMYFFRVVAGFMVQFGMSSKPEISDVWADATIQDEPVTQSNTRGMVTYAKSGAPNSRSTQFFINFGNNTMLDPQGFSPFGKVVEGMDVVDQLYSGYGEQSNDQRAIRSQGKAFFDASFPKLDKIISAGIIPIVGAAAGTGSAGATGGTRARVTPVAVRKTTSATKMTSATKATTANKK